MDEKYDKKILEELKAVRDHMFESDEWKNVAEYVQAYATMRAAKIIANQLSSMEIPPEYR